MVVIIIQVLPNHAKEMPFVEVGHDTHSTHLRLIGDLPARLANRELGLRNSLFCNVYSNIRWGFNLIVLTIQHQRFWCPGGGLEVPKNESEEIDNELFKKCWVVNVAPGTVENDA